MGVVKLVTVVLIQASIVYLVPPRALIMLLVKLALMVGMEHVSHYGIIIWGGLMLILMSGLTSKIF